MTHHCDTLGVDACRSTQDFGSEPGVVSQLPHARPLRVLLRKFRGGVTPDAHTALARRLLGGSEQVEWIRLDRGDHVTLLHEM